MNHFRKGGSQWLLNWIFSAALNRFSEKGNDLVRTLGREVGQSQRHVDRGKAQNIGGYQRRSELSVVFPDPRGQRQDEIGVQLSRDNGGSNGAERRPQQKLKRIEFIIEDGT